MNSIPSLQLLKPEYLPHTYVELRQASRGIVSHALAYCTILSQPSSAAETLALIREANTKLNETPLQFAPAPPRCQDQALSKEEKEYEVHDSFFCIERVVGEPLGIYLRGFFQAYLQLLEEVFMAGTSLTPLEWSRLRAALDAILCFLAQKPASPALNTPLYPSPQESSPGTKIIPLRRWRVGHHAFFIILQSLIISLNCFKGALKGRDLKEAGATLDLATTLMLGSGAAFHFTSDYLPEEYEDIVRPAMKPPHVEIALSGLMSEDHRYFNKVMSDLKPLLMQLDPLLHSQHQQFIEAFEITYDAHKYICARFQGDAIPSLRMNPHSTKTAVEVIDNLKRARLHNVKPGLARPTSH